MFFRQLGAITWESERLPDYQRRLSSYERGFDAPFAFFRRRPMWIKKEKRMNGSRSGRMALGIALGLGLGSLLGAALLDDPTPGIIAGIALGAAAGYFFPSRRSS
jgi:hypothetical protein